MPKQPATYTELLDALLRYFKDKGRGRGKELGVLIAQQSKGLCG
jgi:hypothetical protein